MITFSVTGRNEVDLAKPQPGRYSWLGAGTTYRKRDELTAPVESGDQGDQVHVPDDHDHATLRQSQCLKMYRGPELTIPFLTIATV